jgi:hypothetical protein
VLVGQSLRMIAKEPSRAGQSRPRHDRSATVRGTTPDTDDPI